MPITDKAPIFNENFPVAKEKGALSVHGGRDHHKDTPHKLHKLPMLKRSPNR